LKEINLSKFEEINFFFFF